MTYDDKQRLIAAWEHAIIVFDRVLAKQEWDIREPAAPIICTGCRRSVNATRGGYCAACK